MIREWNRPLRCGGTELPFELLLTAKAIVLAMLLQGTMLEIAEPWAPLLPGLDGLNGSAFVRSLLLAAFGIGAAGVLLHLWTRRSATLLASSLLLSMVLTPVDYRNAKVFAASVLLLIALWSARDAERRFLGWQMAILYGGSALNKTFEPDWWNGRYFEHWMGEIIGNEGYVALAARLPDMTLSRVMGVAVIVIEALLALLFARPATRKLAVVVAVAFHAVATLLSFSFFGLFLTALLASFLVFFEWPESGSVTLRVSDGSVGRTGRRLVALLDPDQLFVCTAGDPSVPATLRERARTLALWGSRSPAAVFLIVAVLSSARWLAK